MAGAAALPRLAEARRPAAGDPRRVARPASGAADPDRRGRLPRGIPVRDRSTLPGRRRAAAPLRFLKLNRLHEATPMRLKLLTLALALSAISLPGHGEDLMDAYRQARANDPVLSQ